MYFSSNTFCHIRIVFSANHIGLLANMELTTNLVVYAEYFSSFLVLVALRNAGDERDREERGGEVSRGRRGK